MVSAVLRPGSTLLPQQLCDWCQARMARFMVPRHVRFVDSLPKTPTDKVEKFQLRQQGAADAWDREAPTPPGAPP